MSIYDDLLKDKYWIFQKRTAPDYWTNITLKSGDKNGIYGITFNANGQFDFFKGIGFLPDERGWIIKDNKLYIVNDSGEIIKTVDRIENSDRNSYLLINENERFMAYNFFNVSMSNELKIGVNKPEGSNGPNQMFFCKDGDIPPMSETFMGNRLYIYSENPTISFEHFIISTIANQIDVMYLTILTKIVNDLELLMNILNSDINIIVQNDKVVGIHGKKSTVVTLIAATTMNEEQFSNISITGIKEILSSLKCSSQIVSV